MAGDGFGQSLLDDLRFYWRFARCRTEAVTWRLPSVGEQARLNADPVAGRFGDITEAIADVGGRSWCVRSRMWHGWPDPPEYAFFAFDPDGAIWCARDFDHWPRTWIRPAQTPNPSQQAQSHA